MAYFIDLFSPETYEAFTRTNRNISGFRIKQKNAADKIKPGDKFICYMTKLSRFIGVLEVIEGPYIDETPLLYEVNDPYIVRFKVKAAAWLDRDETIPIRDDQVWKTLSFTRDHEKSSKSWTGKVRGSLARLEDSDGKFIESAILSQLDSKIKYPIDEDQYKNALRGTIKRENKVVPVSVPGHEEVQEQDKTEVIAKVRDSYKVQALLGKIGVAMGMTIWIPRHDRTSVLEAWGEDKPSLPDSLPINYDDTTVRTIEQIDVLWLKGRSIKRAFEVEHTTSIYSGILRMADLMALQPNMDIKLHIVAPDERRDKVFQEISRPVFSLLEKGPLSELCTYISYDSLYEVDKLEHLNHMSDTVLDDYAEEVE